MKNYTLIPFLFFTFLLSAQTNKLQLEIADLKEKINRTTNSERLKWLDSLSTLVQYKTDFQYDSLVTKTIEQALLVDSITIATNRTADLIYFNNSIVGKPDEGLKLFQNFLAKGLTIKNNYAIARLYLNGADSYFFSNQPNEALKNYKISKGYAIKAKDDRLLGFVNLYSGEVYVSLGSLVKASQNYQSAYSSFLKAKDTFNIMSAKNALAILYSKNRFYEEAKKERDEIIVLAKKTKNYRTLVSSYFNAAEDLRRNEKYNEVVSSLEQAIKIDSIHGNDSFVRPILVCKLIVAYAEDNRINEAQKYIEEVKKNKELYTSTTNKDNYLDAFKNVAFAKKEYKKALKIAKEHLAIKKTKMNYEEIIFAEKFMSKIYKVIGNKAAAFEHLNNYYRLKDSIYNIQKVKTFAYYQTLYETAKRDYKINEQHENIRLLAAENKVKNQWLLFTSTGLLSIFGFLLLLRSRNEAKNKQKLQEQFSQDLINVKESESTRLARELHDSVGQKMMLLTKKIKSCGIQDMTYLADSTLEELRNISKNLYPAIIEQLGITSAIKSLLDEVDAHTNLFFTNEIDTIDGVLDKETNLHIYRILQELLSNSVKHATASTIFVTLKKKKNSINLTVKDNGKGFDFFKIKQANKSLGMNTIFERAKIINAKLKVNAAIGKGTTVILVIPNK
jgi:signal transduction histidine kinase